MLSDKRIIEPLEKKISNKMGSQFGIVLLLVALTNYQLSAGNPTNSSKEEVMPMYRVATVLNYPWIIETHTGYEGILVDLLEEVSTLTNFTYIFNDHPKPEYGRIQYADGGIQVNGVIGALISDEADLAVADLIISDMRSNVVSFSSPFATTGAQILIRPPDNQNSVRHFGMLLVPFSMELWICIMVTPLLTALASYVMDRLGQEDGYQLNALQTFHETLSLFFLKDVHDLHPVSTARRISSICSRTFSFIIIVTYTASLTGVLVLSSGTNQLIPFKTFEQMSRQADIQYGGWFEMTFNLNDNVQRVLNRHISSRYHYYSNIDEAVERVMDIEKPFAAIVEGYDGQKAVNQHCELMLLGEKLFEIEYGLACRKDYKGQQLCSDISIAIGNLKESGKLYDILEWWWKSLNSSNSCNRLSEDSFVTTTYEQILNKGYKAITVSDMLIAFVLVLLGILSSIFAKIVETKCRRIAPTHTDIQDGFNMDGVTDDGNKLETVAQETSRPEKPINGTARDCAECLDSHGKI